jgi:hypothetical protein
MVIYIDKYQYLALRSGRTHRTTGAIDMDTNIAAWLIAGGQRIANPHEARDREQLVAYLESRRTAAAARSATRPSPIARLRQLVRPTPACTDLGSCPA